MLWCYHQPNVDIEASKASQSCEQTSPKKRVYQTSRFRWKLKRCKHFFSCTTSTTFGKQQGMPFALWLTAIWGQIYKHRGGEEQTVEAKESTQGGHKEGETNQNRREMMRRETDRGRNPGFCEFAHGENRWNRPYPRTDFKAKSDRNLHTLHGTLESGLRP